MNAVSHFIWIWGGWLCLALSCLIAFWRGGSPERWGAAILLLACLVTPFVDNHHGFRPGVFVVDVLTLIGFGIVSAVSRRIWTLFATGFQFVDIATHIAAAAMMHSVGGWAYVTGIQIFGGFGPMLALAIGAILVRKTPKRPVDS